MDGKPRQEGKKKGMKRMTGDKLGWAKQKCRGRVDNEGREMARGVTGECCSGSDGK